MSRPTSRLGVVLACACGAPALSGSASAAVVYSNDFQSTVGGEWSAASTSVPPADGSRQFLGRFANNSVALSLSGLPGHSALRIDFELFIMSSWDGDGPEGGTPDIWTLAVDAGPTLLHTTFSNFPNRTQDYPDPYDGVPDGATNPPKAGAAESNTLGYPGFLNFPGGDSVYVMSFTFPHGTDSVTFRFTGGPGLTSVPDESWGLDNVSVRTVPSPGVWLLAAAGGALRLRRRSQRAS